MNCHALRPERTKVTQTYVLRISDKIYRHNQEPCDSIDAAHPTFWTRFALNPTSVGNAFCGAITERLSGDVGDVMPVGFETSCSLGPHSLEVRLVDTKANVA